MTQTHNLSPTLSRLTVRFATEADLPQIAHIAHVTWDATYSETIDAENRREFLARSYSIESLATSIGAPGQWFYVAEFEQEVVGFGHFVRRYHPTHGRAELVRFYVLPDYQNMGIGRAILKTGFAALAEARIDRCSVSVQATNVRAQKIYEQHGFTFYRNHGQFLGTQIITLSQFIRPIIAEDLRQN